MENKMNTKANEALDTLVEQLAIAFGSSNLINYFCEKVGSYKTVIYSADGYNDKVLNLIADALRNCNTNERIEKMKILSAIVEVEFFLLDTYSRICRKYGQRVPVCERLGDMMVAYTFTRDNPFKAADYLIETLYRLPEELRKEVLKREDGDVKHHLSDVLETIDECFKSETFKDAYLKDIAFNAADVSFRIDNHDAIAENTKIVNHYVNKVGSALNGINWKPEDERRIEEDDMEFTLTSEIASMTLLLAVLLYREEKMSISLDI